MKKEKINSINFIKAVSAIGIIAAHFSNYLLNKDFSLFLVFANGGWGSVFAQIFFMVSGAVLFYNYEDKLDLKKYYKKRCKSIFPMFYIAYFLVEVSRMIKHKSLFYRGSLVPYIFTIFGMDGYLANRTTTYYILGEWFLGMIIVLYILFPLILHRFKKDDSTTMFAATILYVLCLEKPIINAVPIWSITSCLVSFVFGMFVIKNRKILINKFTAAVSLVAVLILMFLPLGRSADVCLRLMSAYLFLLLMFAGEWIMKSKVNNKIFGCLSKYSYAIFLLQHLIIVEILTRVNPFSPIKILAVLIIDILVTVVLAMLLTKFTAVIVKSIENCVKKLNKKQKIT